MANDSLLEAIDDLSDEQLERVLSDFIVEHKLPGEFLVWLEKWKALHKQSEIGQSDSKSEVEIKVRMGQEQLKHLQNLSRRATDAKVIGHGSASVVIYVAEFYALEEAVKALEELTKHQP